MDLNDADKPDLEVQRRMIEQRRDQFKATGFDAELEIATLKVQKTAAPVEERQKAQSLKDLRGKAENAYASARELARMLAELPEPEKKAE